MFHLTEDAPHAEAEPSDGERQKDENIDGVGSEPVLVHDPEHAQQYLMPKICC